MSGCSIKLEVGKKYVARGGKVYGPLLFREDEFPFYVENDDKTWLPSGKWDTGLEEYRHDLVREYVEPGVADVGEGRKDDTGKEPIGLIPREALLAEAAVLAFGAQKYDRHNWRKGMAWSRVIDAALRHIAAFNDGEDKDPETGLSHLAHARCCLGFLITYAERGLGQDDRHTAFNADA